jgi:ribonuclease-3
MADLDQLQERLSVHFHDVELLHCALTHRSVRRQHNERLEFLGDAVLSFVVADALFRRYPELEEGELSRVRSGLVNGEMLAEVARRFDLGSDLILGMGEVKSGGQERDSILADAVEAIIGAVYLDSGIQAARQLILRFYDDQCFDDLKNAKLKKDPKSALQEWLQARKYPLPTYEAVTTGEAHAQTFDVTCTVEGLDAVTHGRSNSRRRAEQQAAEVFLAQLQKEK